MRVCGPTMMHMPFILILLGFCFFSTKIEINFKIWEISQSSRWDPPLPPKVCKTPQSFNIGLFENFKSLYCLKLNLETILLMKIFSISNEESRFFSFAQKLNLENFSIFFPNLTKPNQKSTL